MKASDILSTKDLNTKVVEVKEWGCSLTIKELGLEEGIRFFGMVNDTGDNPTLTGHDIAQIVAWGVVDDEGKRVFSDDQVDDLAQKSQKPLLFLYQEIVALSGGDAEKN